MITFRRKTIAVVSAGLVLVGGGAAFAYWTASGSGASTDVTSTTTTGNVKLSASTPTTGLSLGDEATVKVSADNPNSSPVRLGDISFTVTTSNPGCTAADFALPPLTAPAGGFDVAPGASTLGTAKLTLLNRGDVDQEACKGVSVNIKLTAAAVATA